ncbi:Cna B-type domain-containing protein [Frisingicoccus sp.]
MKKLRKRFMSFILTFVMIFSMINLTEGEMITYAAEPTYKAYKENVTYFYVMQEGKAGTEEVVYCFNKDLDPPDEVKEGKEMVTFTRVDGTADRFYRLVNNKLEGFTEEEFYEKVLSVLYHGYPRANPVDGQSIKEKYELTDGEFRYATQAALWRLTDSESWDKLAADPNNNYDINPNMLEAAKNLLAVEKDYPESFSLYLFLPPASATGSGGKAYQNLLSTGMTTTGNEPEAQSEPEETTGSLTVSKTVEGDGADETKDFTFTIALGDTSVNGTYSEVTFTNGVATITLHHGESKTIEGLPLVEYTVAETEDDDYETTPPSNASGTVTENGTTVAFTNTKKQPVEPEKVSVSVTKEWNDNNNQDGIRPNSVTVKLLADGKDTGKTVVLNEENNWEGTFTELDEYKAGKKIEYTVEEVNVANDYKATVTGNAETGYKITNTHTPETTSVAGSKTWDDANNQDGKRPASITIRLHADGKEIEHKEVKADANGNWSWSFENLAKNQDGKAIVYTVTEDSVEGYTPTINGYNVKNTYTPGKTSVTVTKAWTDAENQDGIRPLEVTVKLLADNVDTGKTITLNAGNNWEETFTGLDEYKAGKKIEYTVEEVNVANGYKATVTGNAETGYKITNTHTPETTSVAGSKTWDDNNNQDTGSPKTGDTSNPMIWLSVMMIALAGMFLTYAREKK